jgi:hypothetical protein
MEIQELELRGDIWPRELNSNELFDIIRSPDQKIYSGHWGPESLHYGWQSMAMGSVGSIHCSYNRYKEIASWFLFTMFRP